LPVDPGHRRQAVGLHLKAWQAARRRLFHHHDVDLWPEALAVQAVDAHQALRLQGKAAAQVGKLAVAGEEQVRPARRQQLGQQVGGRLGGAAAHGHQRAEQIVPGLKAADEAIRPARRTQPDPHLGAPGVVVEGIVGRRRVGDAGIVNQVAADDLACFMDEHSVFATVLS